VTSQAPPAAVAPAGPRPDAAGHLDALDGVRAVAAFMVLFFHIAAGDGKITGFGTASWLMSRGEIGVPIFFTLSGLLLYRPWARAAMEGRKPPRTISYFVKRALRILPAYWALVIAVLALYGRAHITDPLTWLRLLTLSYVYEPHPWWNNYLGPNGMAQIWSLTVEVAWYVTLPLTGALLARVARRGSDADRRARRLLIAIACYAAASFAYTLVMYAVPNQSSLLGMWLPRYLIWFAVGMTLAVLGVWARTSPTPARAIRTAGRSWGLCWTAAALCYGMAATPITGESNLLPDGAWTGAFHLILYGLVALFLVAPAALAPDHRIVHAVLGNRVMRYLGRISYSIFLWQFVVIYTWFSVTKQPAFTGNLFLDVPVLTFATTAVATAGYFLVEKPAYRLAHRQRPQAQIIQDLT
jgi:peptidoglycan/LPS O-acetylase OafA/YrhL